MRLRRKDEAGWTLHAIVAIVGWLGLAAVTYSMSRQLTPTPRKVASLSGDKGVVGQSSSSTPSIHSTSIPATPTNNSPTIQENTTPPQAKTPDCEDLLRAFTLLGMSARINPEDSARLREVLQTTNPELSSCALWALARAGSAADLVWLGQYLSSSNGLPSVASLALNALLERPEPEATQALTQCAQSAVHPEVRAMALSVIHQKAQWDYCALDYKRSHAEEFEAIEEEE